MALSFLKKGKEAQKALKQADAEAEVRAATRGAYRFWMKEGDERTVTFLDGDLSDDGLLETVSYKQHNMKVNGKYRNYFPCVAEHEACPLCEMDNYASPVWVFTVMDHTKYTDRNGKVHQHERKLFVVKRDTMKRLQKLAAKRGGLTGWTVNISRTGDKSAEVGSDFDFLEQHDLDDLAKTLKMKPDQLRPLDYDTEIKAFTGDQLREMGFGNAVVGSKDTAKALGKKKAKPVVEDDDDDDDDVPVAKSKAKAKSKSPFKSDDGDDDDDTPAFLKKAKAKVKPPVEEDDDGDDDADDDDDADL